jgi:hypothetical protein
LNQYFTWSAVTNSFEIAVRVFESPDDLGGPPARRRPRKASSTDNNGAPAPPSRRIRGGAGKA